MCLVYIQLLQFLQILLSIFEKLHKLITFFESSYLFLNTSIETDKRHGSQKRGRNYVREAQKSDTQIHKRCYFVPKEENE